MTNYGSSWAAQTGPCAAGGSMGYRIGPGRCFNSRQAIWMPWAGRAGGLSTGSCTLRTWRWDLGLRTSTNSIGTVNCLRPYIPCGYRNRGGQHDGLYTLCALHGAGAVACAARPAPGPWVYPKRIVTSRTHTPHLRHPGYAASVAQTLSGGPHEAPAPVAKSSEHSPVDRSSSDRRDRLPGEMVDLTDKMSVPGNPLPAKPSGRSRAPRTVDWELL